MKATHSPIICAICKRGSPIPMAGGDRSQLSVFVQAGEWFYKPRSGNRELAWSHLLGTLNSAGFDPPFFSSEVRAARDHCWMRAIPRFAPRGDTERRRFYYRTGSLLYLAHIFRAVDLHAANVIIHGEHPVIVDAETFFHPETCVPEDAHIDEACLERTGLLSSNQSANGNPFIDLSGKHLPSTGTSVYACPRDRDNDDLLRGFEGMHDFLDRAGKDRHIGTAIAKLRLSGTRCIFRPTHLYYRLLHEALTPARTRSVADISLFLRYHLEDGLCKQRVINQEVRQLLNGDIPTFNTGEPGQVLHPMGTAAFAQTIRSLRSLLQRRWIKV